MPCAGKPGYTWIVRLFPQRALTGVRITTHQLAKCKQNSRLASKNTNPLAILASCFFTLTYTFLYFWPVVFWLGEWKYWTTCQCGERLEKHIHTPGFEHFLFPISNHRIIITDSKSVKVFLSILAADYEQFSSTCTRKRLCTYPNRQSNDSLEFGTIVEFLTNM
jgi:hypothetical protein